MFEQDSQWAVSVKGFAGKTIYVGHGDDIRGNDAKHRYGDLLLPTDNETFWIYGWSKSWGDICFMFPDNPLFIGNNPEIGPPVVEMRWGDTTDTRKIDPGVISNFEVNGIKYSFHRPEDQSGDKKLFNVKITKV